MTTLSRSRSTPLTDPKLAAARRDDLETLLHTALKEAFTGFLDQLRRACLRRINTTPGRPWENVITGYTTSLTAAADLDLLTIGTLAGWWAQHINQTAIWQIEEHTGDHSPWQEVPTSRDPTRPGWTSNTGSYDYLAYVSDRLVRGLQPPVYEDSFDKVRAVLAEASARNWSRDRTGERIARDLSWSIDRDFYCNQLDGYNTDIDALLDPYGPPGTPAREWARLHDPAVAELQGFRRRAITVLDRDQSVWQARADLIARTEATGAAGFAALKALDEEGWTGKQWIATSDTRTREEHADVDGQTRPLAEPFDVDGHTLQFPGDPAAPVELIANCRCTLIGYDTEPVETEPAQQWPPELGPDIDWGTAIQGDEDELNKIYDNYTQQLAAGLAPSGLEPRLVASNNYGNQIKLVWDLESWGDEAGELQRTLVFYPDANGVTAVDVINELFILRPEWQNHDVAKNVTRVLEAWYRRHGFKRIWVHANIDVGGYTWAKAGFSWDARHTGIFDVENLLDRATNCAAIFAEEAIENLGEAGVAEILGNRTLEEWKDDVLGPVLEKLAAANEDDPTTWPRPYDLATLGAEDKITIDGKGMWVGKCALLRSDWHGVKQL